MVIHDWIKQAREFGASTLKKSTSLLGTGTGYVQSTLGRTWLFGSTEQSTSYDHNHVDERHYFLVPNHSSKTQYSLYVLRCLPDGVPPINDLPKQRVVHLPNPHAMAMLEEILVAEACQAVESSKAENGLISGSLDGLADQLDQVEAKMFGGILLIGGLVALVNPIAGAVVAAKAAVPSIGLMLSKYGFRYVGDSVKKKELARQVQNAEKKVRTQFRNAATRSLTNPLLEQLDHALRTDENEFDPLLEFSSDQLDFGEQDRRRLFKLTAQAISNTYATILAQEDTWQEASLGPEDVRFLRLIAKLASD